ARTPHSARRRASGATQPLAPLRCPGGEDRRPLRCLARLRHDQARCWPARLRHDVPRGRQMMRCRALLSDRGSSAIELAVLAPALMLICMLILQFGLWFNARQTALAAAQAGAVVARQEAVGQPGPGPADARGTARQYHQKLNSKLLKQVNAATATAPGGHVYVTVSCQVAGSVFPFFGLELGLSATGAGPVECFRPPS